MTRVTFSVCFMGFFLCSIVCPNYAQEKKWCIAQSHLSESRLQEVLDYMCGIVDCKEIQPGESCFEPDTRQNHASYAIDLNYRITGVCDFSYATTIITDPCKLLYSSLAH
ncbi:putative glucan endo-1,3-beta-D-glucosidase [Helianthus debilis subsp. tardiflorus]